MVKPGNRIKFNKLNPIKEELQAGDVPEVVIEPSNSMTTLAFSSQSTTVKDTWVIKVSTNVLTLEVETTLRWLLIKAISAAKDNLDLDFVVRVQVLQGVETKYDPEENRGTVGWHGLLTLNIQYEFLKDKNVLGD